jgi:hypothetical protein
VTDILQNKPATFEELLAVIAWDSKHLPETERVAYIDRADLQKRQRDST